MSNQIEEPVSEEKIILFIDAVIKVNYSNYGDKCNRDIWINGLEEINKSKLLDLDNILLNKYGEIDHNGSVYKYHNGIVTVKNGTTKREESSENENFQINYKTINKI